MNPEARASIVDGTILVFNSALVVDLAILRHGPKAGRKIALKLAKKVGYLADVKRHIDRPVAVPSSEGDTFANAAKIVGLIGHAAGEELNRLDYYPDNELDPLIRAFREGLTSEEDLKDGADGTLPDLFRECGKHSRFIISAAVRGKMETDMNADEAKILINYVVDAFADAVLLEVAWE
jgi:hypothetical protein